MPDASQRLFEYLLRETWTSSAPPSRQQLAALRGEAEPIERHLTNALERLGKSLNAEALEAAIAPEGRQTLGVNALPREGIDTLQAQAARFRLSSASIEPPIGPHKYTVMERIGAGGMGEIHAAYDHELGRTVALKRPIGHSPTRVLMLEARLTGQLEHPNIVPVFDIGFGARAYYAMKLVSGRSLSQILDRRKQDHPSVREFTRYRLLQIFVQICQATHFAHVSGVLHRDLKPDNIMVGEHGEVYLMDWGLARALQDTQPNTGAKATAEATAGATAEATAGADFPAPAPSQTRAGQIKGTPQYMSPEQAMGRNAWIHAWTDIFLLGATLYEILTFSPPYSGRTIPELIDAASFCRYLPPGQRSHGRGLSPVLEAIVLKAIAWDPRDRHATAQALAEEVQAYLDGSLEQRFQKEQAERLVREAEIHQTALTRAAHALAEKEARADDLRRDLSPWAKLEDKRPIWGLEAEIRELELSWAHLFAAVEAAHQAALSFDPRNESAREGLAALHWERFLSAEQEQNSAKQRYHQRRIEQLDAVGYTGRIRGYGTLELTSDPEGAEVVLYRCEAVDRLLTPRKVRELGPTPLRPLRLPMGSYFLELAHPAYRTVRYPVHIRRDSNWIGSVTLHTEAEIGPGFIYIPGGPCTIGERGGEGDTLPRQETQVPGFCVAEFPVTFAEYLVFLNAVQARDPEEARRRAPQDDIDGLLCTLDPQDHWRVQHEVMFDPMASTRYPPGLGHEGRVPITSIDFEDALAYAAWRSDQDGCTYRLPNELEWEKAARGVDGRTYPWGDRFEAFFCKMYESRPERAQPEPIGVFPADVSPYGVRDMAGSARDWTSDVHRVRSLSPPEARPDPTAARVIRGGMWCSRRQQCRCAERSGHRPDFRDPGTGLRLVRPLRHEEVS